MIHKTAMSTIFKSFHQHRCCRRFVAGTFSKNPWIGYGMRIIRRAAPALPQANAAVASLGCETRLSVLTPLTVMAGTFSTCLIGYALYHSPARLSRFLGSGSWVQVLGFLGLLLRFARRAVYDLRRPFDFALCLGPLPWVLAGLIAGKAVAEFCCIDS